MLNPKLIIYIVTLILISIFISIKKPEMHKQAVITDSQYSFYDVGTESTDNTNTQPANIESQSVTLENTNISNKGEFKNNNIGIINSEKNNNKPVTKVTQQTKSNTTKNQPDSGSLLNKDVGKKDNNKVNKPAPKQIEEAKTIDVKPTQNVENKQTKPILTEQEEIIAWNHWRSRLQNQVMMDSKISAPIGTQFKFTFTVDKYGNMSNVKVWSTNPAYSDLAVRVIKPVLMSYRNKQILNFPYGTQRIITNVEGGFVISRVSRYSSPSDYNDYEHVKR